MLVCDEKWSVVLISTIHYDEEMSDKYHSKAEVIMN